MTDSFIPYGFQYYRATTPLREDWEKDLENIKSYGFNTIKLFALWRWNNPKDGVYYFDDMDELMNLAHKNNLKVIINILFDLAPAWFFKKYPDSVMITCDGRRVEPQVVAHRSVGGAPGPCYNHGEGVRIRIEFLAETVRRYRDHPALYIWDVWNEPELTCGILRQPIQRDMVCYCDTCKSRFLDWLMDKYGCIGELNKCWSRNYNDWDEVELPRSGDVFTDMIDWRVFFSHVLTEELRKRVEAVKRYDTRTPVMVHTVPIPYFNAVNSCNNDYDLAALCDMFGNSIGSHPFAAAFSTSCAEGKMVINSEIHALGGDTYNRPKVPSFENIKGHIFIPLARGVKGFVYWQYRPETLGRESPAWGLTTIDGGYTDWLGYNSAICRALQENAEVISTVKPLPAEIAVVNSFKGQVFDWCASSNVETYIGSVIGVFMALYDANLNVDIIGLENLTDDKLKSYKVVFLPFPYYMDGKMAALLKQWVYHGGCLVSEAFFGAVAAENGLHSRTVPGYGFTDVFGMREGLTVTASKFRNAYTDTSSGGVAYCPVDIIMDEAVGNIRKGDMLEGHFFIEALMPESARVLGKFRNGETAITMNSYGKGKAVMLGSLPGFAYYKTGAEKISQLVEALAEEGGIHRAVKVEGGRVRVDLLKNDRKDAIIVINSFSDSACRLTVRVYEDIGIKNRMVNIMTGEEVVLTGIDGVAGGYQAKIEVCPCGHNVYKLV